ncbi:MAG: hypothetical protein JSU68_04360, partial [Phycisphaerales bacterium]
PLSTRPWLRWLVIYVAVGVGFGAASVFVPIPVRVQADNCQILLAVDRLSQGFGPTTIYPKAPETDWSFINHWPVGYPLLLWAVKTAAGTTTITAARVVNVAAYALALIAWAVWLRRCLPRSRTADLLAVTAAVMAVSATHFWRPSTDMILVALTPLILLWVDDLMCRNAVTAGSTCRPRWWSLALLGLAAGGITWLRYTGLFLTLGLTLYFIACWLRRTGFRFRHLAAFCLGCLVPLVLLAITNATFARSMIDEPASAFGVRFEWSWFATWWRHFAQLPLFTSQWRAPHLYACYFPVAVVLYLVATRGSRRAAADFFRRPAVQLSLCAVAGMFALMMIYRIFAWSFFVTPAEPRYLMPVRPFYLLAFVGPLLVIPWQRLRQLLWLPLAACLVWLVQAEWIDAARTWAAEHHSVTAYGRQAVTFQNDPDGLYTWLRRQNALDLIIFSNFFDDIALETHIAAQPLPEDVNELHDRVVRITRARNISTPRVLFVLNPDNIWRTYYLPVHEAIQTFGLKRAESQLAAVRRYVFTPYDAGPRPSAFGSSEVPDGIQ